MPFLSIVIAYCLSRYTRLAALVQHDYWLKALVGSGALQAHPALLRLLVLGLVPLATGLLVKAVGFWLAFLCGLVLLLYGLGREGWRESLATAESQLWHGNAEAVWLAMESRGEVPAENHGSVTRDIWLAWRRHTGRTYLDGIFAILFWFFLLGPAGAVLYRAAALYREQPRVQDGRLLPCESWLAALDWLPARYMALCACLAGNFTPGFQLWRSLLLDTRLSANDLLARCLEASLFQQENTASSQLDGDEALRLVRERSPALRELLERTEIIGLVGLAAALLVLH